MNKLILIALLLTSQLSFAGKIQNEDVKTLSELTGAGGSISQLINDSKIYVSSLSEQLSTGLTNGDIGAVPGSVSRNLFLNGNFELWQRGSSITSGNGSTPYLADRFYVINSLGTNGVLTYSRVSPVQTGSKWGASVQITTAPTAAQANGTAIYQTLENVDTLPLLGKQVSSSVQVKALGNVSQIGLQFMYKTSEAKVDTTLGAESTCNVNTSTFVLCKVENISVGTTPTSSGVIGIRIRVKTVSSGNTYDLNNGFVVEQVMANAGALAAPFARKGQSFADELEQAQRFYEKTYPLNVDPGTNDSSNTSGVVKITNAAGSRVNIEWKRKRIVGPVLTFWGPNGSVNYVSDNNCSNDDMAVAPATDTSDMRTVFFAAGVNATFCFHWTVDAEI